MAFAMELFPNLVFDKLLLEKGRQILRGQTDRQLIAWRMKRIISHLILVILGILVKLGILVMILVNLLILDVPSVVEWTWTRRTNLALSSLESKSYLPSYNTNLCRNAQLNTLLTTWNIKTEFAIVLDAIAM